MKKTLLLGLTVLLSTTSIFGQEKGSGLGVDVEVNEHKTGRGTINFGSIDGYQFAQGRSGFVLYFFPIGMHTLLNKKENGEVIKSVKLEDKNKYFKRKKLEVTNFFTVGEHIVEIVPRFNKKTSKYTIYAEAFNSNLKSKELAEIYETKASQDVAFSYSSEAYNGKLLLKVSRFKNKKLVSLTCLLVDQELNTEEIAEVNVNERGTFTGSSTSINSNDTKNIYAITTNQKDDELEAVCYQIDLKRGRSKEIDLDFSDLEDKKRSNLQAEVYNDKLYIFGFSKVEKSEQVFDEYFTQIYDLETKKLISTKTQELEAEFIIKNESDKEKSRALEDIKDGEYKSKRSHSIIKTFFLENGNILHLATNYSKYESTYSMKNLYAYLLDENGELIKKENFQQLLYGQSIEQLNVVSYMEGNALKLCYVNQEGLVVRTLDVSSFDTESEVLVETNHIKGYAYNMTNIYSPKENEFVIQGTSLSKEQSIHITF